jgi:hypothetical protein
VAYGRGKLYPFKDGQRMTDDDLAALYAYLIAPVE